MEHSDCLLKKYKSEHTEIEYLNHIQKNKILNIKNWLLKFQIDFTELKDR